jgi:hypothetical protein
MPKESLSQQLAYELFILKGAQTNDATAQYVAGKVGIGVRTFWTWYKKFNWAQRAEEFRKERGEELKETTAHALRQIEDVAAEIIEELVTQFKKKAENEEIKIERVSDLESLIRTFMTLTGRMPKGDTTINVITAVPRPETENEVPGAWKALPPKPKLPST